MLHRLVTHRVQMIDTSVVRMHQHGACIADNNHQELDRTVLQQDQANRRVATRYDKLAANYLAFVKLASIRIWLRANEFTP